MVELAAVRPSRVSRDGVLVGAAIGTLAVLGVVALVISPHEHQHDAADARAWVGYAGMWTAMVVAMMLPTSAAMALALVRVGSGGRDRTGIVAAAGGAYLVVWLVAGLVAHASALATGVVENALGGSPPGASMAGMPGMAGQSGAAHLGSTVPSGTAGLIAAGTLVVAGALQLSPVTSRCLTACRAPAGFFARHWHGGPRRMRMAARIGLAYGLSCLGCCAALMIVLLLVGMENLAAMAGAAALMVVQKNTRIGRRVATGTGVVMLLAGAALAARGLV